MDECRSLQGVRINYLRWSRLEWTRLISTKTQTGRTELKKPKHKSKRKMSIEAQRQTANVINQEYSKRILFWLRIHVYPSNYPSPNDLCRLLLVLSRNYRNGPFLVEPELSAFWMPEGFLWKAGRFFYSAKGREIFVNYKNLSTFYKNILNYLLQSL